MYKCALRALLVLVAWFDPPALFGLGVCIFFKIDSAHLMPVFSVPHPSPDQLAARRQLDEARQGHRDRKQNTRRKIIAGAIVLAQAERDPVLRDIIRSLLRDRVTRPIDRAVLADLIGE